MEAPQELERPERRGRASAERPRNVVRAWSLAGRLFCSSDAGYGLAPDQVAGGRFAR